MDLAALNERFAIPGRLAFEPGGGGLPWAHLADGPRHAAVALQGAHVLSYGEAGATPVLWASAQAIYAPGKAIRGGIPVCWPWFGPHPGDPTKPAHGFARTAMWEVRASGAGDEGPWLTLGLRESPATLALWPHPFELQLTVTLGARLRVALLMRNSGDTHFTCGGALHSYFDIGQIGQAAVHGLDGVRYLDQLTGVEHVQTGPVRFGAEVDRVYYDAGPAVAIADEARGRRIVVAKAGSRSTVVWNPWVEKARRLADFGDEEYGAMLCVETAMALDDSVTLAPGQHHNLSTTIWAEPV